jgi:hypothetical protein
VLKLIANALQLVGIGLLIWAADYVGTALAIAVGGVSCIVVGIYLELE